MSRKHLIAVKPHRYGTRALRSGDPYDATEQDSRVLIAVGLAREAGPVVPRPATVTVRPAQLQTVEVDLRPLREEFERKAGRKPDMRWGAARLAQEIAAVEPVQPEPSDTYEFG